MEGNEGKWGGKLKKLNGIFDEILRLNMRVDLHETDLSFDFLTIGNSQSWIFYSW